MANSINPVTNQQTGADGTSDVPHTHDNKLAADDTMMADQYKHIPGWGMDADDKNDPQYPMRHYNGADHQRINYAKPTQQPVTVEILRSIERPTVSSVVSDRLPPKGLSGAIRRKAFEYSEGKGAHWIGLILADRVNMVEGIIEDLAHGHIPNIVKERGWNAEWKYNKKGVIKNVLIGAALIGSYIAFSSTRNKKKNMKAKVEDKAKSITKDIKHKASKLGIG